MSQTGPRDWLILETSGRGHRSGFVRLLVDESSRRTPTRRTSIVTSFDAVATDSWRKQLDSHGQTFELVVSRRPFLRVANRLLRLSEHVVVPDGDRWLPSLFMLSLVMRWRLVGCVLILRPTPDRSTRSRMASVTKHLLRSALARLSPALRVFDLAAAPTGDLCGDVVLDPIAFAPLSLPREEWLARHQLACSARVALLIGDISERKCVGELVDAVRLSQMPGLILVAVGRPTPAIRSIFAAAERLGDERVRVIEGFISNEEFDTWVAIADAVCVVNRYEGSSGVLLKAWAAGTPLLVGGSWSVIAAARALGAARIETLSLQPEVLVLRLQEAVSTERAHVATEVWESRTAQFVRLMLGP